jgi:hypothetical protein
MKESAPGKSLWEYVLLAVSVLATLVQVLGLISQSQALFAQPSITVPFVLIVLIGTAIACIIVLIRRKPGAFTPQVPYYSPKQRGFAVGLLATNFIVSMFVLRTIISRPCLTAGEPIPPEKFGILVANFTEGPNRFPTLKGAELAQRTQNALEERLATSSLVDSVEARKICFVKDEFEARKAGQSVTLRLCCGAMLRNSLRIRFNLLSL